MDVEGLGDLEIHIILSKLTPVDVAVISCVSHRLKDRASDDSLWAKFCSEDLNLTTPLDSHGNPLVSFKEAYQIWRRAFEMYPWSLVKRVRRCWNTLESWLATYFPEAKNTLRKGASEAEIKDFENKLKVKLPTSSRLLYRFCDGQSLNGEGRVRGALSGIIGGYSFYDHVVNVYLLPLSEIMLETKAIIRHWGVSRKSKYIVVAASSTDSEKLFLLNCSNGQLYVGTKNLSTDGEMIPCVLINPEEQLQESMLMWLEEHARRLQTGILSVRTEGEIRSINLFPEFPPLCSIAVSHGVKIRASAVLVPELSDLEEEHDKYLFSYSIRMSLLTEGCAVNGMTFRCCQLYSRHWIINTNDKVKSDVRGEGVIGKFPLLLPGEREFVYESCCTSPSSQGSIEGDFTFVPGSLQDPKGDPFLVKVAKFPIELPTYIF